MGKPYFWKKAALGDPPLKAKVTWETDPDERVESDCGCYTHKCGGSWEIAEYFGPVGTFYCGHCDNKNYDKLRVIWYADSMSRNGDSGTEWELVCFDCKGYTMFSQND